MKLVRDSLTALGNNTLGLWANEDGYASISHTMSNGGTENNSIDISIVIDFPLGRMPVNVAQLYFVDYLIEVEKRKVELNCELFEQQKEYADQIWEPQKTQENRVDWLPEAKRRLQQIKGEMKLRELMLEMG